MYLASFSQWKVCLHLALLCLRTVTHHQHIAGLGKCFVNKRMYLKCSYVSLLERIMGWPWGPWPPSCGCGCQRRDSESAAGGEGERPIPEELASQKPPAHFPHLGALKDRTMRGFPETLLAPVLRC